jgi:hypothetical protein
MRLQLFIIIIWAVNLLLGCGGAKAPVNTGGQESLRVIRFPASWRAPDGESIISPDGYAIRKLKNSSTDELLFAGVTSAGHWGQRYGESPNDSWYGANHYAVSLDGKFQVRPATEGEWKEGLQVANGGQKFPPDDKPEMHTDTVEYQGKMFAKTGDYWSGPMALFSQQKNWVALFSYSNSEKRAAPVERREMPFPSSGGHEPGEIFVDVYNTNTGAKVLAGHASYNGFDPSILFSKAVWIEDHYFVMPLDLSSETCFLGLLPN